MTDPRMTADQVREILQRPFPEEQQKQISKRKHGPKDITIVEWWHYVDRLNELPPGWWQTLIHASPGEVHSVILRVKFGEEGWADYTNVPAPDPGQEENEHFGGNAPKAFWSAFKRCCAMVGLGRHLYTDDKEGDESGIPMEVRLFDDKQVKILKDILRSELFTKEDNQKIQATIKADPGYENMERVIEKVRAAHKARKEKQEQEEAEKQARVAELRKNPTVDEAIEALDLELV